MTDEQRSGIVGAIQEVGGKIVTQLTPAFLGMLLLNVVFVLSIVWLFERQGQARERVLAPILLACSTSVPLEALQLLYRPEHNQ